MLTASGWASLRGGLVGASEEIGAAVAGLDQAVTGFSRQPFTARCAAGHCLHDGYFHIGCGWQPAASTGAFAPGHYRTKDFVVAERAVEPLGLPDIVFHEMASFNGRIWRGPGLDDLEWNPGDDLTTDAIHSSETGAAPWTAEADPPDGPRECGLLLAHDGYLYSGLGERYKEDQDPVYVMHRDIWRKAPGGAWEMRSSDIGFPLRSFGQVSWNGRLFMVGGADETNFTASDPLRIDTAKIRSTADGFLTLTDHGDGPFIGYGMRLAHWRGGVVMVGGASGNPTVLSDRVWFSDHPELAVWTELASLPEPLMHAAAGALTIDGVEALAVIGGYVIRSGQHLAAGTIYTLDDPAGQWVPRTDSDFWTD